MRSRHIITDFQIQAQSQRFRKTSAISKFNESIFRIIVKTSNHKSRIESKKFEIQHHVSITKVSQFFWHASFDFFGKLLFKVCFFGDLLIADLKLEDDFSNSNYTI